jgi:hypothetical protein
MDNTRLDRFADSNPGFQQYETRFKQAIADPDLLDVLCMEESERIRQAGMKKAIQKQEARDNALRLLKRNCPIEKIAADTGLTVKK